MIEVEEMLTYRPLMPLEELQLHVENVEAWRIYVTETLEETPPLKSPCRRYPKRKRSTVRSVATA
jgi:hypothetical protein